MHHINREEQVLQLPQSPLCFGEYVRVSDHMAHGTMVWEVVQKATAGLITALSSLDPSEPTPTPVNMRPPTNFRSAPGSEVTHHADQRSLAVLYNVWHL